MPVYYDGQTQQFHLQAGQCSYVMQLYKGAYLVHRYFGRSLSNVSINQPLITVDRAFSPNPDPADEHFSLDTVPLEYPVFGSSDFRLPAIEAEFDDGSSILDLRYVRHRILPGKPQLIGLPATYVEREEEAQTVEIDLQDAPTGLVVTLRYTAFAHHGVIARSVSVANHGVQNIRLKRVLSAVCDFPSESYHLIHLPGAHAREREMSIIPVGRTAQFLESRRGASSHQQNPFFALATPFTTEDYGDVFAFSLVYSGNFLMGVDTEQFGTVRAMAGINPFGFGWLLRPSETFHAPEALLGYSQQGLGAMSRDFHRLFRKRLVRGAFRDQVRPVLINNWEATYFHFDQDTLLELGQSASLLGIELFVLDDGWFGHRDDDRSSLGDWKVDIRKLPEGLSALEKALREQNMQFGIWVEPEMVSPDSELYRTHPDWCLHVGERTRSTGRHQLVLDFSRSDVCEAILDQLTRLLQSAPIRYVKWDMNRHMTEVGSKGWPIDQQREIGHRYILGLYYVLEELTRRFPAVLFESCSGGGGRFDPGMLYYMPQVWTSDNTDAIGRLSIQFGTSLLYPSITMGAHVSAVPNHQVGRITPVDTRGLVAMMGNLGYEMDVRQLTDLDREKVSAQILLYKEIRQLVLFGDLYRLRHPHTQRDAAWMYVSEDRDEAFVTYVRILAVANSPMDRLILRGLEPQTEYHAKLLVYDVSYEIPDSMLDVTARGDELMAVGLMIPHLHGDFRACAWKIVSQPVS